MKPIGKYIVVKDIQETVKTESGLILSGEDTNQLRYKRAEVIAPGSDVTVIDEGGRAVLRQGAQFYDAHQ